MQKTLSSLIFSSALSLFSLTAPDIALASGGGTDASAGAPVARLEPFVVNLSTTDRYLQAILTLQVGASEIADKIKLYMPKVRHTVILTLSAKEPTEVQTSEGKKELIEELKSKLNKVLELKEHDGVNNIFLENFVIQ